MNNAAQIIPAVERIAPSRRVLLSLTAGGGAAVLGLSAINLPAHAGFYCAEDGELMRLSREFEAA
jgi:hypothetical protein